MKNKRITFLLSFCLPLAIAWGEIPPAKTVFTQYMNQAQTFANNYPREKAYLHFDNTSYYVGDTIWFKAYVTLAEKQTFSPISRPLYVELVDQTGHIADKQIIKLTQGEGNGQFILPRSMLSGYYEVRAYTRWMLAFNEPQYFSRTFPIYQLANSDKLERSITTYELSPSMENRPSETKEKLSVRFFPEGGQLVEGVTSQVAFKAESKNEGNIELSGTLYTKEGAEITSFETLHDGMGHFEYTPSAQPAVAKVDFQGKKYEFTLPQALPNGYVLSTVNNAGALLVKVSCNTATPQDTLAVFISYQGRPYVHQLISCRADAPQEFILPTRKLPAGVLQVSLINRAGNTLCERFVFSNPRAPLQLSAEGLKEVYTPYAPIRCELQVKNAKGEPVSGDVSVSIRDAVRSDYLEYDNNIFTDLLLTSDLKGYIETPGYYFKNNTQRLKACLDNLMLTQGWSRFNVEDLLKEQQTNPQYFMEIGQFVSGKVLDIRNKPLAGKHVNVFVNKRPYPSIYTDSNGVFLVDKLSYADTARVEAQVIEKGKIFRANVQIDRDYFPEATNAHPYINTKYQHQNEYIEEMQSPFVKEDGVLMLRLPEVVINARTLVKDRFSSYKMDDEEMLSQQDARTALDLVKKVPGFRIIDNRPYINPKYSQRPEHLMSNDVNNRNALRPKEKIDYGRTARFMLDNRAVGFNVLSLIDAADIIGVHKIDPEVDAAVNITQNLKYLEAAYNEAFESGATLEELEELEVDKQLQKMKDGSQNISGGCIVLTSRTGNLAIPSNSQGDTAFLLGFNRYKSFYSPKYTTDIERQSSVPDNRTTIYWQPKLLTDENGNANVHFYTADRPSYYTVVIEGITDKGVPCRYEYLLKR